jgi:predicted transcriptional regulator of viral defense system
MKYKNTSSQSSKLIQGLHNQAKEFFKISDALNILTGNSPGSVSELINSMIRRGLVMRIARGLYNLIPYELEPSKYFPDWHLTAKELAKGNEYYIGFYSALDIHGLVTQPSVTEQIVTVKQFTPKRKKIKEVEFEFICLNKRHFFGFEYTWIDNFNKVKCSDPEKTIIDSLYLPHYSSGIAEIVKAIYRSKDKLDQDRLIKYLEAFGSQSVLKRLGFILHHLDILYTLRKYIEAVITDVITPLDPSLPKKGKYHTKWKVQDNAGIKEIINSIET